MQLTICCVIGLAVIVIGEDINVDQYKQFLLDESNRYRKMAKASDMIKLEWDDQLAKEAQDWVNGCQFKHKMAGRGENLAFDSSQGSIEELVKGSMKRWYDEINMYSYGAYSCGSSCHYTQMVWAKTKKIGCGMKRCISLMGAKNAFYIACFYDPMGNMMGDKPYSQGKPCSACPDQCDDGLCKHIGEVKSDIDCSNKDTKCEGWAKTGQCDKNPVWMKKNCKKACNTCT